MPDRDTTVSMREQPARITHTSSRAALVATARYLSTRIARELGVPEIPVEELDIEWADLESLPASGQYQRAFTALDKPNVSLDREFVARFPDPTEVLAHELAHAYTLRGQSALASGLGRDEDKDWVAESMADYVVARLGFIGGITDTPSDPTQGYEPGARFLAWLDEFKPDTGFRLVRALTAFEGVDSVDEVVRKVTGQPLDYLLAMYEENPFVEDAEGPFARMLRNRADMGFLGQRAMDIYLKKSQMFMAKVAKAKRGQRADVSNRLRTRWWTLSKGDTITKQGLVRGPRVTKPGPGGDLTPEPERPSTASALRRRAEMTPDEPETSKQVR